MEKLNLSDDIIIFGVQVITFPVGIGEAFDDLANKIPEGRNRDYYGISWIDEGGTIIYYAMAAERFPGEATMYNYKIMTIEKGEYLSVTVKDWQSKTATLKDIFHNMMEDPATDNNKPCIEWYKAYDEMLCMMKEI